MQTAAIRLALLASLAIVAWPAQARQDDAQRLIALAREALGGEAKLVAVTSFTASGRVQLLRPARSGGTFELAAQFPDKFVRTGQTAAVSSPMSAAQKPEDLIAAPGTFALGFNAGDVIVSSLASGEDLSDPRVRLRYLARAHEQALQLLLGLFAGSMPGLPVRFSNASGSDTSNSVVVSSEAVLPTKLSFDPVTHLPARFGNTDYQDYRSVDGMKVPFRLVSGQLSQEIRAFHYNVPINPKLFRPTGR